MTKSISEINLGTKFKITKSKTAPYYVKGKFLKNEKAFTCCAFDDSDTQILIPFTRKVFLM